MLCDEGVVVLLHASSHFVSQQLLVLVISCEIQSSSNDDGFGSVIHKVWDAWYF